MKITISAYLLSAVSSAGNFATMSKNGVKASYMNELMRQSKPLRQLYDNYQIGVDISSRSLKFVQCQFIKAYDDDLAQDQDATSVLATNQFAIFRLCPNNDCSNCNSNYGEYIIDLESYLYLTMGYFNNSQAELCELCGKWCDGNQRERLMYDEQKPYDLDCSECAQECVSQSGFIDASEFLRCVKIYDDGEENGVSYYAAPVCSYGGERIKIGVFSDKYCSLYESDKKVEDYLAPNNAHSSKGISDDLLKKAYKNTCISCQEPYMVNQTNEFCQNMYSIAGKCELENGFMEGYYNVEGYQNQLKSEYDVCHYINSIKSGHYDESGEIAIQGSSEFFPGIRKPTPIQRFALAFFILGTAALTVYAMVIKAKIKRRRSHYHVDDNTPPLGTLL